ncbi:hypothetical protein CQA57_07085 [Helicobacter anseris]|uniref:Metal-dependent hydrolase n=1 Tax=Helicobacter anseris TaxID=375926 RepID=A0A3D8J554_9HELI|nr:metal-dependent hydrolase [Helicobacter anseris]RDU72360.1 hypothetical protein CQA57_07085 [Helicobacter anseris]
MIFKTHMAFAVNVALLLDINNILVFGQETSRSIFYLILLFGSVFPDIDEPNSFIGKKFPGISHFLCFSLGHRGFTHFLAFPILFFIVLSFFIENMEYVFAFCLGIFLHQVGDMLTNSGIKNYFYPIPFLKRIERAVLLPKSLRFSTGMLFEKVVFLPLMIVILLFLGYRAGVLYV